MKMIRKGTVADSEGIMGILKRAVEDLESKNIWQWDEIYPDKKIIMADLQSENLYIEEEDGKIKGLIVLNEEQDEEYNELTWQYTPDKILLVHRVCVDPLFGGQGVGKNLMKHAEEYARDNGYGAVRLDAFIQNPVSCGLYEKIGYHKVGIIKLRKGEFYCFEKSIESM
jgi:ribosomal protein S18 acetylase RimI-like enzyme